MTQDGRAATCLKWHIGRGDSGIEIAMIVIAGASDGLGLELAKLHRQDSKTVVNIFRREYPVIDCNLLHDM